MSFKIRNEFGIAMGLTIHMDNSLRTFSVNARVLESSFSGLQCLTWMPSLIAAQKQAKLISEALITSDGSAFYRIDTN